MLYQLKRLDFFFFLLYLLALILFYGISSISETKTVIKEFYFDGLFLFMAKFINSHVQLTDDCKYIS